MAEIIAGIRVPDSAMARAATQLVRDTEDDLLYNHSRRVFFWGALTGKRRRLKFDPELLYIGAMFHDMGLTERMRAPTCASRSTAPTRRATSSKSYGVPERDIEDVWTSIALHTTPGVPEHMRPTIALVTAGVEMDVLGIAYDDFPHAAPPPCLRAPSARSELQGEHHRPLRQRHHQKAADHLRQRQGRRAGTEGPDLSPPELLRASSSGSKWPDSGPPTGDTRKTAMTSSRRDRKSNDRAPARPSAKDAAPEASARAAPSASTVRSKSPWRTASLQRSDFVAAVRLKRAVAR